MGGKGGVRGGLGAGTGRITGESSGIGEFTGLLGSKERGLLGLLRILWDWCCRKGIGESLSLL